MQASHIEIVGALIFGLALLHTFTAKYVHGLGLRFPKHANLFHLLGEVEIVFGFWALILLLCMAFLNSGNEAIHYVETRHYTEPVFVFVIMVVAASRPVLVVVQQSLKLIAKTLPLNPAVTITFLGLGIVPLIGSFITEPAAMTLAALTLAPIIFRTDVSEKLKYAALGVLFVNISIGGTLTSYAAPPVLMVASVWQWDSGFMLTHFGWKAAIAVLINALVMTWVLRKQVQIPEENEDSKAEPSSFWVSAIHLLFLAGVVAFAHHPVIFMGLFMFFLGYTHAYQSFQNPLILKEGLLVGFFLAGLVVLGGLQQWWLQPIVESLSPLALFFGAVGLTAITDNAALTYLGSLISGISDPAKIMLVSGAVVGGGLTVIANAPNPAGVALLRKGFDDESIGVGGLFLGALLPTICAGAAFLLF